MHNSVEHEILNAHKYIINVKMPAIIGILTFMSRNNFISHGSSSLTLKFVVMVKKNMF